FLSRQMEWRLGSWVEVVQPLQVKYDQLGEPDIWNKDNSCFLLPQSMLCQLPFVFYEGVDGLSEFFPHPFSIVDVSSIDNTSKDL
ncbi:hypothetical protein Tco_1231878, partial [Tanacetum coccineum]